MNGLISENVKLLIYWIAQVEYVRKGRQGDHNIRLRKKCNHQEDQRASFHTQVVGDKSCQRKVSEWTLMGLLQSHFFLI